MPLNSNQIISGLSKQLTLAANAFVVRMKERISQNNLPDAITKSITIGKSEQKGGTISIEVSVGGKEGKERAAVAYEYGSGLQRTRGSPAKYKIEPDEASVLAFEFKDSYLLQRSGQGLIPSQEGKAFFAFVDHPGVAARPFVQPSVNASREEIKEIVGKEFKAMILAGTPKVTVINA
jgi:hypothetical protein